jgi:DNA-binding transcriptional regulator YhcF (GntR family)
VKLQPEDLGSINDSSNRPKFLQIADRVRELIDSGKLSLGDRLPSINETIAHFSVSRDTAVKAYQELKDRGIIESTPNKACFVSNVLLHEDLKKVLFLIDALTPYKAILFSGILDNLGPGYYVDIITHGDNFEILKAAYEKYRAMRNCAALLVIPTASQNREFDYFRYVNPGKLLFLDRRVPETKHPAVWQDFADGFFGALMAQSAALEKYRSVIFLTKYFTNPILEEMNEGLSRFANATGKAFEHRHTRFTDKEIQGTIEVALGDLFFILDDHLVAKTLDACKERGLRPGKDLGLVAINDGPLYEQLSVPMSVLTADFYAIGAAAARFILSGEVPSGPVETRLIVRESV